MNSFQRFTLFACSLLFAVGCAKTEGQKAQDAKSSADLAIAGAKNSLNQLNAMGAPSANWSYADLDRHEALINSCEADLNRIEGANGKDGVTVYGTETIPRVRMALSMLRSQNRDARVVKSGKAGIVPEEPAI